MNLRPRRRDEIELNLTPLIDVVFLLLIFFMVATTFKHEAQLRVDLPEASSEPTEVPKEILEITINVAGEYFINEQQVVNTEPETLRRAIVQAIGNRRDMPVIVRSDARTPFQAVVTVMDVTGKLGMTQLSLATSQPGEAAE